MEHDLTGVKGAPHYKALPPVQLHYPAKDQVRLLWAKLSKRSSMLPMRAPRAVGPVEQAFEKYNRDGTSLRLKSQLEAQPAIPTLIDDQCSSVLKNATKEEAIDAGDL